MPANKAPWLIAFLSLMGFASISTMAGFFWFYHQGDPIPQYLATFSFLAAGSGVGLLGGVLFWLQVSPPK